jgi:DNA-binding transcriptional MerR regulator
MRMSELAERTGLPVATLKFYLRERLLMPGTPVSATRSDYGEQHVRRALNARSLTESVGLSVQQAREVFRLIDSHEDDLFDTLGRAIAVLPPAVQPATEYPRAQAAIEALGQLYDPRFAAVAQLERALENAEAAGVPLDSERLAVYGPHIRAIAEYDVAQVPADREEAVEYAVLGTALHEPVLVALRRLAHQDVAAQALRTTPQKSVIET